MLAFMAYPGPVGSTGSTQRQPPVRSCESRSMGMDDDAMDGPPPSILSLSTEASSSQPRHVVHQLQLERDGDKDHLNHSVLAEDPEEEDQEQPPLRGKNASKKPNNNKRRTPFMEQLYENTVDGPCQTVTLCEVQHFDLFLNCQQPLSFWGFGALPRQQHATSSSGDMELSFHLPPDYYDDDLPMPGAYAFPRGCEYCGAAHTRDCRPPFCKRPTLFFQKKRPPFAPPDATLWDPATDQALTTTTTTKAILETRRVEFYPPSPPKNKLVAHTPLASKN